MDDDELERLAWAVKGAIVDLDYMHPWRKATACRSHPTSWWFPERGETCEPARRICTTCPVSAECAAFLATLPQREQTIGVWAGTSGRDRRGRTRSDPQPEPGVAVA